MSRRHRHRDRNDSCEDSCNQIVLEMPKIRLSLGNANQDPNLADAPLGTIAVDPCTGNLMVKKACGFEMVQTVLDCGQPCPNPCP